MGTEDQRFRLSRRAVLTASLAVGLAACSKPDGGQGPDSGSAEEMAEWTRAVKKELDGKKVTVAMATDTTTEAVRKMGRAFTQATGIAVNFIVTDANGLKNKQLLDFQSGSAGYDVEMVDSFYINEFVTRGMLEPLDPTLSDPARTPSWFAYDDFADAYRSYGRVNDKIYGIPFAGATRIVGYRKDLFAQQAINRPANLDDFLAAAKRLKASGQTAGIAMRGLKGVQFSSGLLQFLYQFSDGFFDPKSGAQRIAAPENVQALEYYVELLKTGPQDISSYGPQQAVAAFTAGKAGMWYDGTPLAVDIADPEKSTVSDQVEFTVPPSGPNGHFAPLAGWNLSIASKSKEKQAAWAFICWMLGQPNDAQYLSNGGAPTRLTSFEKPPTPRHAKYYPSMIEALKLAKGLTDRGISWIPQVPQSSKALSEIGNQGARVLAGEIGAKQALETAASQLGS